MKLWRLIVFDCSHTFSHRQLSFLLPHFLTATVVLVDLTTKYIEET